MIYVKKHGEKKRLPDRQRSNKTWKERQAYRQEEKDTRNGKDRQRMSNKYTLSCGALESDEVESEKITNLFSK